jgi:uncharacterized membrane protein
MTVNSQRRFHLVLFGCVVIACWIIPAAINSLWLDETGTYWIAKDRLRDVFSRSYYWSNFSPYYVLAYLAIHLGGVNELLIRMPSIICMAMAAFFIYRIGTRVADEDVGLGAAVLFSVIHEVAFSAADARPYAFTITMLTAYVFALLRWLEIGTMSRAVAVAVAATLTLYAHALMAPGLVAPAAYALWHTRRRLALITIHVGTAVLAIPLAIQLHTYFTMGAVHMFAGRPAFPDLWATISPDQLVTTFWVGVALAYASGVLRVDGWRPSRSVVFMLTSWVLLGPFATFTLARVSSVQLYVPRYLMYVVPAQALLLAMAVRALGSVRSRRTLVAMMTAISIVAFVESSRFRHGEDWRGAMALLREKRPGSETPIVIPSCFVEAQSAKYLEDPLFKDVLFAPELVYPPAGHVVHVPYKFDETFMHHVTDMELAGRNAYFTLSCGEPESLVWLSRWATEQGFRDEVVGNIRGIDFREFRR